VNSDLRSADRFPVELLRQLPPQTTEAEAPPAEEPAAQAEQGAKATRKRRATTEGGVDNAGMPSVVHRECAARIPARTRSLSSASSRALRAQGQRRVGHDAGPAPSGQRPSARARAADALC
jgi:hypothetical protein